MESEREDLDALLQSPGWQRFVKHVEQEWGREDGGGAMYHAAILKIANNEDDPKAMAQLRQVVAAQREIRKILSWPKAQLAAAIKAEQDPVGTGSRRGGL